MIGDAMLGPIERALRDPTLGYAPWSAERAIENRILSLASEIQQRRTARELAAFQHRQRPHPTQVTHCIGGYGFHCDRFDEFTVYGGGGTIHGSYLDFTGEWVPAEWDASGHGRGAPDLDWRRTVRDSKPHQERDGV
jgi:hypothetical protein